MTGLFIFLGIHFLEIIGILFYLLIRKNKNLETMVINQQQYIDAIGVVIEQSNDKLQELDAKGTFTSDDEVGFFFEGIKEIQTLLNDFNNKI